MIRFAHIASLAAALLACSCGPQEPSRGTPFENINIHRPGEDTPDDWTGEAPEGAVKAAEFSETQLARADEFRKASTSKDTRNGVYVYSVTATAYGTAPEKLAARIAVLGFRDVYLSPGSSAVSSASQWLRTFISSCHGYGIDVYAVKISDISILASESKAGDEVNSILNYNKKVQAKERFDGISADLEAHTAKSGVTVGGTKYTWDSSANYGKGKDNDMLLKYTIERLASASEQLHGNSLKLNEAYWYNYQVYYDKGQLNYGAADQFLAHCDWLVDMAYAATSEAIWNKSEPVLKAASAEKSVSICLKVKINQSSSDSLLPKGWQYLLDSCKSLLEKGRAYASFRGLDQFTFEGLEQMMNN